MMIMHYLYTSYQKKLFSIQAIIFTLFFLLIGASMAYSSPPVDATFLRSHGPEIVMELSIKGHVPANVIVDQYFHPANKVIGTFPPARKLTPKRGEVKWLFRNVKNGRITITTRLAAPLRGPVRAVVRFRDPRFGNFIEFEIRP